MKISPSDLVCMDECEDPALRVELAYASPGNLLFGEAIYRPGAGLWLHRDLAGIVKAAAAACYDQYGFRFVLYDGLRTIEAQAAMLRTRRVRENPQWLEEPRLLSPPGAGGHPRAMAVDAALENGQGALLDMGTPFDFLAEDPGPLRNPAHRQHPRLSRAAVRNRNILSNAMTGAAAALRRALLPLPQEWWDFRFPADVYDRFAPLSDKDLPPEMRMGPLL